jgi:mycothiol synthase
VRVADKVPEGFELRPVAVGDAPAVTELVNEVTLAEIGLPWTTVEETRDELTSPVREAAPPEALLVDAEGAPAGYLQFSTGPRPGGPVVAIVFVRPRLWGRDLNAWLLRLAEERARVWARLTAPGGRVALQVARFTGNEPAGRLFASLGFRYVRTYWMMRIDLDAAPPAPTLPAGIRIRTFVPGLDEERVHAALAEAFAEHWGRTFPALDEWRHVSVEGEGAGFEPSLWFVAVDGEEIVGAACCQATSPRAEGTAQVSELAVRRAWRRRGVGLALLRQAFREFHRRGIHRAELGVDAGNPTGATCLYERAGMHVALSWEFWEKEVAAEGGGGPRPPRSRDS